MNDEVAAGIQERRNSADRLRRWYAMMGAMNDTTVRSIARQFLTEVQGKLVRGATVQLVYDALKFAELPDVEYIDMPWNQCPLPSGDEMTGIYNQLVKEWYRIEATNYWGNTVQFVGPTDSRWY